MVHYISLIYVCGSLNRFLYFSIFLSLHVFKPLSMRNLLNNNNKLHLIIVMDIIMIIMFTLVSTYFKKNYQEKLS